MPPLRVRRCSRVQTFGSVPGEVGILLAREALCRVALGYRSSQVRCWRKEETLRLLSMVPTARVHNACTDRKAIELVMNRVGV